MKIKFQALILIALLALAVSLPGCSTTAQQRSYQTANTTAITVDAAMTAWGGYVAQFHPPASEEQQVKDAFDKYRSAMTLVADAGKAWSEGTGTQANLDASIATAGAALADLVNLIQSFGVNIQTK